MDKSIESKVKEVIRMTNMKVTVNELLSYWDKKVNPVVLLEPIHEESREPSSPPLDRRGE